MKEREVHWQTPRGAAPAAGWPAVVLFQGSYLSAELTWAARRDDAFGAYFQTKLVEALLEAGFVVITPEAKLDGASYWDTNIPPWAGAWTTSADHALMLALFDETGNAGFGPVDQSGLFAAGISSGGYMTSRMAEAYPGRFRALAIQSASWATCGGPVCTLPMQLPADHPPTLFLHGEADVIVPISTAKSYAAQLLAEGHVSQFVSDKVTSHAWLAVSPREVTDFFLSRL